MNLQTLRDQLATIAETNPEAPVRLDFGIDVNHLDSWRGDYAEATLTWARDGKKAVTVKTLLDQCDAALGGTTFEGYKGGTYRFTVHTDVWADDWGRYNGNRTVAVVLRYGSAYVITQPGSGA